MTKTLFTRPFIHASNIGHFVLFSFFLSSIFPNFRSLSCYSSHAVASQLHAIQLSSLSSIITLDGEMMFLQPREALAKGQTLSAACAVACAVGEKMESLVCRDIRKKLCLLCAFLRLHFVDGVASWRKAYYIMSQHFKGNRHREMTQYPLE